MVKKSLIALAAISVLTLAACETTKEGAKGAAKKAAPKEKHLVASPGKALEFRYTTNNVLIYKYPKDVKGHILGRISTRFVVPVVEIKGEWLRIKGITEKRSAWVKKSQMGKVTDKY